MRTTQCPASRAMLTRCTLPLCRLLSATGALLGIACASRHIPDNARVAAVTSSIWAEYSKASEKSLGGRQLQLLLLDMEAGRIGVAAVDEEYLLACVAAPTAMWGMLKLKVSLPLALWNSARLWPELPLPLRSWSKQPKCSASVCRSWGK